TGCCREAPAGVTSCGISLLLFETYYRIPDCVFLANSRLRIIRPDRTSNEKPRYSRLPGLHNVRGIRQALGRLKLKRQPDCLSLSTQMRPPCASMIALDR